MTIIRDHARQRRDDMLARARAAVAMTEPPAEPVASERHAAQVVASPPAYGAVESATEPRAALVTTRERYDGDQILRYIYTLLKRFAEWGSEAEIVTATLWIAMTHARDGKGVPIWQYCARLGILGPSGSGKSWKSRLIGKLASNGEILVEATKAAFIDACAENQTVIITEADEAFRTPGRSRGIVAVANAGYEPDRASSRKQGGKRLRIPLFCHVVLDGIDEVLLAPNRADLRPLISRTIVILARPAPAGYRPPRFDGQARAIAAQLGQRCAAWMAQEVLDGMADDVPHVPGHLGLRPFALWEPLFTVALRADNGDPDGPWSRACAVACEQLESAGDYAEETPEQMSDLDRQMAEWGDEDVA